MWADDDYPSARTRSLVKLPLIKELVDSDELDLGTVDITAGEGWGEGSSAAEGAEGQ